MSTNVNYECEVVNNTLSTTDGLIVTYPGYSDKMDADIGEAESAEARAEVPIDIKYESLAIKQESLDYSNIKTEDESVVDLRTLSKYEQLVWTPVERNCDICQWKSWNGLELVAHRHTHTRDSNYTCLMCSSSNRKSYSCKRELRQHMRIGHFTVNHEMRTRIHATEISYECDICSKRFKQCDNLTIHKRVHSGEKPYECNTCHKRFTKRTSLVSHERVHSGEKPYECNTCHNLFSDTSLRLVRHIRIHSREKPYECDICHWRFTISKLLVRHKLTHCGPYECNTCHTRTVRSSLVSHERIHNGKKPYERIHNGKKPYERIHNGEKPYECDTCHKLFSDNSSLVRHNGIHIGLHERIHSGHKPYECDICHYRFAVSPLLDRHKHFHSERNLMNVVFAIGDSQ